MAAVLDTLMSRQSDSYARINRHESLGERVAFFNDFALPLGLSKAMGRAISATHAVTDDPDQMPGSPGSHSG